MRELWYNKKMEPNSPPPLKGFTQTGGEAAREILKPQRDPAYMRKAVVLSIVVFVAMFLLGFLIYQRSGKSLLNAPTNERKFEPPQPNVQ